MTNNITIYKYYMHMSLWLITFVVNWKKIVQYFLSSLDNIVVKVMNGPGYIVAFFTIEQVVFLMLLTDKEVAKKILCLSCSKNATMHIIEHDHIILLSFYL